MPAYHRRHAVVAVALLALLWPMSVAPTARALDTVTFTASADSQVNESRPTSNYGTGTTLRVRDASKDWRSFVQFNVSGLSASPVSATLRLWVTDASPDGGTVSPVPNTWTESGITWNTAPALGTPLGAFGTANAGTWVELDVTTAVTANGTVSFAIASGNGNSVVFSSREGGEAPQLVLVTDTGTPPPPPPAPVASFSATPTSGTAPLTVAFTDTSTNSPTSWAWDFDNNGSTDSTAQNPSFTYTAAGTYSVKLTATNAGGSNSVTQANLISVGSAPPPPPPAPVASFSATPTSGTAPLTVAFTDTSTNSPTSWAWDFDNNGSTDSTAQNPSFTYTAAGTYSVKLTATNAGGSNSVTQANLISVGSAPPPPPGDTITLAPTGDAYVNESRPSNNYGAVTTLRARNATDSYAALVKFDVSGLSAPPTAATLRLFVVDDSPSGGRIGTTSTGWSESTVTWSNHPAIGTTLAELGPAAIETWMHVDVTSAIAGNGTVAFYIQGISGNSVVYSSREGVQPPQLVLQTGAAEPPQAPVADFTASPTTGAAPLTVAFTDTSANGPTTWAWDFDNNGTTDSNSQNPSHTYTAAGTYTVKLTVSNLGGSDSETKTNLISVANPPPPPTGSVVMVGAGDIASCTSTTDEDTANLIDGIAGNVFTIGDNVLDGLASQFTDCYDPSWGRFKSRTRPAPGNHEYDPGNPSAYFNYFGSAAGAPSQGWYSYDVGSWHVIVLNSECAAVGGCTASSPQTTWLRADLAASNAQCTMAIFHRPLFTSSRVTGSSEVRPLWTELYNAGAELVLNGHAHMYDRFAPQRPDGVRDDANGIRQIISGTGGHQLHGLADTPNPNSQVRNNTTHGVLKLTLSATGYAWQFIPVAGQSFTDSGSDTCH